MTNIVCYASDGSVLEYYYQWSVDQSLIIKGADTSLAPVFYFSNVKFNTAFIVNPEIREDSLVVTVPNILLQHPFPIIIDADYSVNSKSDFSLRIPVMPKAKPGDYVYNDNSGSGGGSGDSGSTIQIADNLTTNSSVVALAASQGVVLKSMIDGISGGIDGDTFVLVQEDEPEDKSVLWVDTNESGDSIQDIVNAALNQAKESGQFDGADYVLTETDKNEIAEIVSDLFGKPEDGGSVDLIGYATEQWVRDEFQEKGNYLTAVPDGYAKISDIPTSPEDIGAQPKGDYLLKTDITVQSVNGKTGMVQLNASDVGALPDSTTIPIVPTTVSSFDNDAGYLTKTNVLSEIGVTVTSDELNCMDGIKHNVQAQLDERALSSHDHSASDITSGTLPIVNGGTDANTAAGALRNLGAVSKAGDEMTGTLTVPTAVQAKGDGWVMFKCIDNTYEELGGMFCAEGTQNTALYQKKKGAYSEFYWLPPSTDNGTDKSYTILTSKQPVTIAQGGIGASNGATGLKNLLAAGYTVLSSYQYGTEFPASAPDGTIFFKKVT